jgi:hypothetical protein
VRSAYQSIDASASQRMQTLEIKMIGLEEGRQREAQLQLLEVAKALVARKVVFVDSSPNILDRGALIETCGA